VVTQRRAAAVTGIALLVAFVVAVILTTPWQPLPGHVPGGSVHPDAARDFTAAQIAREASYHAALRPWGYVEIALALLVPALLGFTRLGADLVGRLRRLPWLAQVVLAAAGVTLAVLVVELTFDAHAHAVQRDYGLSTQDWGAWFLDVGRGYAVGLGTTLLALFAVMALARRFPRRWWVASATAGALLVVIGSFVYPVVVEPVFNNFRSLPAGSLRTELLALAARDHVHLDDILIADASRRTTTDNAYVSGFGASRRLVL